jgi:hypothetical protein
MEIVELEFGLHRRETETYTVELRVSRPDSDAETRVSSRFPVGQIDLEAILPAEVRRPKPRGACSPNACSRRASCAPPSPRPARVADAGTALRLRLFVGPSAPELQVL